MGQEQDVKLIIEDEEGGRFVIPIEVGDVSLGRDENNTIHLSERNVSRKHARIFRDAGGKVFLEDLGSYNGVCVGGQRIDRAQAIEDGARFEIGGFRLEIRGIANLPVREETTQRNISILAPIAVPQEMAPAEMTKTVQSPAPRLSAPETGPIQPKISVPIANFAPEREAAVPFEDKNSGYRLLGLSGEFLGKIWPISKPETIIGRGSDSGIVLDHRSVSRHHARLIDSAGRLRIVDLKSSNGILISGEVYKEAELRSGDIVELGHILLRICAPGEDATLTAQEKALGKSRARGWRVRLLRLSLLVGAAAIAGGGAYLYLSYRRMPAPIPAPKSSVTETPINALLRNAHEAASAKLWPRATTLVQAALALAPDNTEARALSETVAQESLMLAASEEAEAAAADSRWADAYNALMQAPKSGSETPAWRALMDKVKPALEAERMADARHALDSGDFDEAQTLVEEVRALDPDNKELASVTQALGAARHLAEGKSKARTQVPTVIKSSRASRSARARKIEEDRDLGRAEAAYNEGTHFLSQNQASRAIRSFQRCAQADKTFALCYRALGIAQAKAKNGPEAVRNYRLYLKVSPGAQDAAEVRKIIQQYERAQTRG